MNKKELIVICINKLHRLKAPLICEPGIETLIQACVDHFDHNYLLYRSVDYGKRASTFGTIFKHIRAQRRAVSGCFGFTGKRGM